tara:strand:+ start:67 stop:369 length:303 start_codon:yes stop_codon:yes gene_type:complete
MLVLSRKVGERLVIDGGIIVEVTQAGGGKAKLGVDAPPHISVNREEVQDRVITEGSKTLPYAQIIDAEYLKSLLRKMKGDKAGLASIQREVQRLILSSGV